MVAADHEIGDQVVTVQHETILMTVGDSSVVYGIGSTEAEQEDGPGTAAVLPEIIHLDELQTAVAVDTSDAMPIIHFGVSSDYNIGDTTELNHLDTTAGHEPLFPAGETGGQPGALNVGINLAALDNHDLITRIDVHAMLRIGELLPRRDNTRGELPEADDEGIFSIISEHRRVEVDFGWGIVVGGLSRDDFNEMMAFPACLE